MDPPTLLENRWRTCFVQRYMNEYFFLQNFEPDDQFGDVDIGCSSGILYLPAQRDPVSVLI